MLFGRKSEREFTRWASQQRVPVHDEVRVSHMVQAYFSKNWLVNGDTIRPEFMQELQEFVQDLILKYDGQTIVFDMQSLQHKAEKFDLRGAKGANVNLVLHSNYLMSFSECDIGKLSFSQNESCACLSNSKVGEIFCNVNQRCNLTLSNCWVRNLALTRLSIGTLDVIGGRIANFDCPMPGQGNPFDGSVTIVGTFVPRTKHGYQVAGAQPYRNMRFHLAAIQNAPASSFFHSAEQAMERDDERGVNWWLNYLYEKLSDYGSSPARPLWFLACLWIATTALLYCDGVAVSSIGDGAIGWQKALTGDDVWHQLFRSATLGIQPISWVGGLTSQGRTVVLAANSVAMQLWLMFSGVFSAILIALFIFAVRRRFRMVG